MIRTWNKTYRYKTHQKLHNIWVCNTTVLLLINPLMDEIVSGSIWMMAGKTEAVMVPSVPCYTQKARLSIAANWKQKCFQMSLRSQLPHTWFQRVSFSRLTFFLFSLQPFAILVPCKDSISWVDLQLYYYSVLENRVRRREQIYRQWMEFPYIFSNRKYNTRRIANSPSSTITSIIEQNHLHWIYPWLCSMYFADMTHNRYLLRQNNVWFSVLRFQPIRSKILTIGYSYNKHQWRVFISFTISHDKETWKGKILCELTYIKIAKIMSKQTWESNRMIERLFSICLIGLGRAIAPIYSPFNQSSAPIHLINCFTCESIRIINFRCKIIQTYHRLNY